MWKELYVLPVFQQLAQKGLAIKGARVGFGGAHTAFSRGAPKFWNGDGFFTHVDTVGKKYNFFVGGAFTQSIGGIHGKVHVDGNIFMSIPGLCGDSWRDMFGKGRWSAAAKASLALKVNLLGANINIAAGEANVFMSLGGDQPRKACTTYGEVSGTASPSGVFFNGQMRTPQPFGSSIIADFFPSVEASVDAYLLSNEGSTVVSKTLQNQMQADLEGVLEVITGLKDTFIAALNGANFESVIKVLSAIRIQLECTTSGSIQCWAANPLFTKAAESLQRILDLAMESGFGAAALGGLGIARAQGAAMGVRMAEGISSFNGDNSKPGSVETTTDYMNAAKKKARILIAKLKNKRADVEAGFGSALSIIANNLLLAAQQPFTEITDLSAGFGLRGKVQLRLGHILSKGIAMATGGPTFDYFGIQAVC